MFKNKNILPFYTIVGSLDGCNFSANTVWEGQMDKAYSFEEGKGFYITMFIIYNF